MESRRGASRLERTRIAHAEAIVAVGYVGGVVADVHTARSVAAAAAERTASGASCAAAANKQLEMRETAVLSALLRPPDPGSVRC